MPAGKPSAVDVELAKTGRKRRIVAHLGNFLTPPHVIAESDLILTCPESLARTYADAFGLEILSIPVPVAPIDIKMVWHERNHEDPFQRWMREKISHALAPQAK